MQENSKPRNLTTVISVLLLVTIVVDAGILVGVYLSDENEMLTWGAAISQVFLLAMWTGLGTTYWLLRLAIFGTGAFCWGIMLTLSERVTDLAEALTILAIPSVGALLLTFLGHIAGWRWTTQTTLEAAEHEFKKPVLQFTLGRLLGWTTVAAIAASLSRFAELPTMNLELAAVFSAIIVHNVAVTLMASVSVPVIIRAVGCISLGLLASGVLHQLIGDDFGEILALFLPQTLFIAMWVGALRTANFRIHRIGRPLPAAAPNDESGATE